ncbi:VCBS repeat-containing protein [Streptomyces sp. G2]|uniref:FG-GAP repeat domain-containing protein n=1 Tax=Streptomyces sp. G2 TaxID=1684471 RepID=UPI00202FB3C6|nr:VCBS repeat-containing protein [Streptomyces sp. G2]MCM1943770.1 VCBS repeat-containing protein [Streptomyces sp. G2]
MTSVRPPRRLGAAVATVLAVTLGAGVLASPAALADPAAATASEAVEAALPPIEPGSTLVAAGAKGFFTEIDEGDVSRYRWTRYADGATHDIEWPSSSSQRAEAFASGDLAAVAVPGAKKLDIYDGAKGGTYTVPLEDTVDRSVVGLVAGGALTQLRTEPNGISLKLNTPEHGTRLVTHMPSGRLWPVMRAATSTHALLEISGTVGYSWLVVDLATADVVADVPIPARADKSSVTLSGSRMAWVEYEAGTDAATAVVRDVTTHASSSTPLGDGTGRRITLGLLGDWLTFTRPGGMEAAAPSPFHALTARHLRTGETLRLLDHTTGTVHVPEGGHLVRGGSVAAGENGEGNYRVALDGSGRPAASLVATTGEATALAVESFTGHTRYDGSGWLARVEETYGPMPFTWKLNHGNARVEVTVKNRRTGRSYQKSWVTKDGNVKLDWDRIHQLPGGQYIEAFDGTYSLHLTAAPLGGVGPVLQWSQAASFAIDRHRNFHDVDANSSPDLFARDASGTLWTDSTVMPAGRDLDAPRTRVGGGWQAFDKIEHLEGWKVVARDRDGVLWHYQSASYGTRVKVGGGWQQYVHLAGGSDVIGDASSDLLAVDGSGVLWLYETNEYYHPPQPFRPRKRVGGGWQIYNQITAVGDVAGGPAGDLVARDRDGVLWLYLGKGDGTFTTRTKIGGGWQTYAEIMGGGDADHDGKGDLLAYSAREKRTYFYGGTGDRAKPFEPRRTSTVFSGGSYNHLT